MSASGTTPSLTGLRVLAVEDEALVAMMLEVMLEEIGCEVVGVAGTLQQAFARIASTHMDAAILDVNIGGEKVYPVADALVERGVPFVFCTGYDAAGLPDRYRACLVLNKPYTEAALAGALASLSGERLEQ